VLATGLVTAALSVATPAFAASCSDDGAVLTVDLDRRDRVTVSRTHDGAVHVTDAGGATPESCPDVSLNDVTLIRVQADALRNDSEQVVLDVSNGGFVDSLGRQVGLSVDLGQQGTDRLVVQGGDAGDVLTVLDGGVDLTADGVSGSDVTTNDVETYELRGNDGDDELTGGVGDDVLAGGSGDNALVGGDGQDTVDYSDAFVAVDANLGTGEAAGAGIDTLDGIENLVGTPLDDSLAGDNNDNLIDAGDGDDLIRGFAGRDRLRGGSGDDTVHGNLDSDSIDGQAGSDTLHGDEGGDGIDGGSGEDTLDGGESNDVLDGGGAIDLLFGDSGADRLRAGDGDDELYGDEGGDTLDGQDGADVGFGGTGSDSILGSEGDDDAHGGTGADTLRGGFGADTLRGGEDSDQIAGQRGDDDLQGGAGTDTVSFRGARTGVTVSLAAGEASGDGADVLSDLENVKGSDHADHLRGDGFANVLRGGSGGDWLSGGDGNDGEYGESGNDWLDQGRAPNGGDMLSGGSGSHDVVDPSHRAHRFRVVRDGVSNDGQRGEHDNVQSDIDVIHH
jgi:Ca2+-binding RTX toxin-like protein